jgi:hypothetical protein
MIYKLTISAKVRYPWILSAIADASHLPSHGSSG